MQVNVILQKTGFEKHAAFILLQEEYEQLSNCLAELFLVHDSTYAKFLLKTKFYDRIQNEGTKFLSIEKQKFYENAHKVKIYGHANCELRTYDLAMELLKFKKYNNEKIHCIKITPMRDNEKLEPINFVAIGDWPNKGCDIISPWCVKNRIFKWGGSVLSTPEFSFLETKGCNFKVKIMCDLSSRQIKEQILELYNIDEAEINKHRSAVFAKIEKCLDLILSHCSANRQYMPGVFFIHNNPNIQIAYKLKENTPVASVINEEIMEMEKMKLG